MEMGMLPRKIDLDPILNAFQQGDFSKVVELSTHLVEQFPDHDFGWKALGAGLQSQGRIAEAVGPMSRAAILAPVDPEVHFNLGVVLQAVGKPIDAEASYRRALRYDSNYLSAAINLAAVLQELGRNTESLATLTSAVERFPDSLGAQRGLALFYQAQGMWTEAESSFRRALEISPHSAQIHAELANLLLKQGKQGNLPAAEAVCRQAIRLDARNASYRVLLGEVLVSQDQDDLAEMTFLEALQIDACDGHALDALARIYRRKGQLEQAREVLQKAIDGNCCTADHHLNLGVILSDLDKPEEAEMSYRRALEIDPRHKQAHFNLGVLYQLAGRFEEAVACFKDVIQLAPDDAKAHCNCGNALMDMGRVAEAEQCYRKSILVAPEKPEAYQLLGLSFEERNRFSEAESMYRDGLNNAGDNLPLLERLTKVLVLSGGKDALEICDRLLSLDPESFDGLYSKAIALNSKGNSAEAEIFFRKALERVRDLGAAHAPRLSSMLFRLSEKDLLTPEELFDVHVLYGAMVEERYAASPHLHSNSKDEDRVLRVGFVSADLRDHTLAFIVRDVLRELSRLQGIELHAFYNFYDEDESSAALRPYFKQWHRIAGLPDRSVFDLIQQNHIDVLIDLSGHTKGHRLGVFAMKPAPIQASWIGYPATTGMTAMDYYIGDRFLLPPDRVSRYFTEALVHLPASVTFSPWSQAPDVGPLPALTNGYVTFGSFNREDKISRHVIDVWLRLMERLPESRLIVAGVKTEKLPGWFRAMSAERGIARERMLFLPRIQQGSYQALHNKVDIALDPFPYSGGTTTCHAMWMGVPTLTLEGGSAASRQSVANLSHAGLGEFVACDEADFIERGVHWASDLKRLSALRLGLRQQISESVLLNPRLVAAGLRQAIRVMWIRWCQGLPAELISVSAEQAGLELARDDQAINY